MSYVTTHMCLYYSPITFSVTDHGVTSHSRSYIDIGATVAKHSGIVSQLIAVRVVSGCDTVNATLVSGRQMLLKSCWQGLS